MKAGIRTTFLKFDLSKSSTALFVLPHVQFIALQWHSGGAALAPGHDYALVTAKCIFGCSHRDSPNR